MLIENGLPPPVGNGLFSDTSPVVIHALTQMDEWLTNLSGLGARVMTKSLLDTFRGNSMRTKTVPPLTAYGGDESATISRSWFPSASAPTGNPVSRPAKKTAARYR